MTDGHNKAEDREVLDASSLDVTSKHASEAHHEPQEPPSQHPTQEPPPSPSDGRSARQRAMKRNHDQKVWGEVLADGSNGEPIVISNPVPVSKKLSTGEKTRRAMALKLSGASYAAIADALGYSDASGARKAVMRGMKSSQQESASELRKIHYARLEHLLALLWPDVTAKDLPSMDRALSVMDRMEKLLGLNAAAQLDITTGGRETVIVADGDKDSYLAALQEAGATFAAGSLPPGGDLDTYDEGDDTEGEVLEADESAQEPL